MSYHNIMLCRENHMHMCSCMHVTYVMDVTSLCKICYYYAPLRRSGGILLCTCRSVCWSVRRQTLSDQ